MTVAVSLALRIIICKEGVDLSSVLTVGIFYKIVIVISKKNVYNIHREPQCKYPRRNWDSPNPSLASVPLPPAPRGGGKTSLRMRGWGSPNSDDRRKA